MYPSELERWRASATQALAEPEEVRASPQQTRRDQRRILAVIYEGIRDSKGMVAACFNPRHGVRATRGEDVVELVIDLQPTSNWFDAGHRLRLTIAGADHETCDTPVREPAAEMFLYRSAAHPSRLVLPIIPQE